MLKIPAGLTVLYVWYNQKVMLTPYSNTRFIEKTLTDCQGRQFRALFLVSLVNGEVKGRLVSLKLISPKVLAIEGSVSDGSICLPSWTAEASIETPYFVHTAPRKSPYFNIDLILTSQPTRAPSRA